MSSSNKEYVEKQIDIANSTNNEDVRNDALYRAGTAMEVIPCTGNVNLSETEQNLVITSAANMTDQDNEDWEGLYE